jgi:hypothetical protein
VRVEYLSRAAAAAAHLVLHAGGQRDHALLALVLLEVLQALLVGAAGGGEAREGAHAKEKLQHS